MRIICCHTIQQVILISSVRFEIDHWHTVYDDIFSLYLVMQNRRSLCLRIVANYYSIFSIFHINSGRTLCQNHLAISIERGVFTCTYII